MFDLNQIGVMCVSSPVYGFLPPWPADVMAADMHVRTAAPSARILGSQKFARYGQGHSRVSLLRCSTSTKTSSAVVGYPQASH